jgi:shikimate kinase
MTTHIALLGLDGSGKSTVARSLPALLSARHGVRVGGMGEAAWVSTPDEDLVAPGFVSAGLPTAVRLNAFFRRLAKAVVNRPVLYSIFKLIQMLVQDVGAHRLARRYRTDVMVSDGNLVLCTAGRAANYLWPASNPALAHVPVTACIQALFMYLLHATPVEPRLMAMPRMQLARGICGLLRLMRIQRILPHVVVFLDCEPTVALQRAVNRKRPLDRHENLHDMTQAREQYAATLRMLDGSVAVHVLPTTQQQPWQTLDAIHTALDNLPSLNPPIQLARGGAPQQSARGWFLIKKLFHPRYVLGCLVRYALQGAWREPFFLYTGMGRLLLREGYSANVMASIYRERAASPGLLQRIFLGYPLHRAVGDRLPIVQQRILTALKARLCLAGDVRIFTGPSGFSEDVMGALSVLAVQQPHAMKRVSLIAADLDPEHTMEPSLRERAEKLGISFTFHRGDLCSAQLRRSVEEGGPLDLAVFVGLSAWLPRRLMVGHLRWLSEMLGRDGTLVTDCFTAAPYAASGHHMGYRANYHSPALYSVLLSTCALDVDATHTACGRDGINHVLLAHPRRREEQPQLHAA